MTVDRFKLAHWMNARKLTAAQVAERAGVPAARMDALLGTDEPQDCPAPVVGSLAAALAVTPEQLAGEADARDRTALTRTGDELAATRRPVTRDGIHFYNYYSMVAPPGRVGPVVLDILCPPDRLPALNNGHLEPAITVNLGPGDIHGRWGEEIGPLTWRCLETGDATTPWITGASYVEPSWCPHSYALAGDRPARIVSYTAESGLAPLVEESNAWSGPAFDRYLRALDAGVGGPDALDLLLDRRGHDRDSAARAAGVSRDDLDAGTEKPLDHIDVLRAVAGAVGVDYRVLLPADRDFDEVGKTWWSAEQARASIRGHRGLRVASMAAAPHLTDLSGLFLEVDRAGDGPLDPDDPATVVEPGQCHYLVVSGEVTVRWTDAAGGTVRRDLGPDGSIWTAPFVAHRLDGRGAVLKFGSGVRMGRADLVELASCFDPAASARRGRRDVAGWGYES